MTAVSEVSPALRVDIQGAGYSSRVDAIHDISFEVSTGATVLLLGANGAGKSTLLSAVMGLVRKRGTITAFGHDISRERPDVIARRGVYLIPEGRGTFGQLTVDENLRIGSYHIPSRERAQQFERVFDLFPVLADRRDQLAGTLSGGEQQKLALSRALVFNARLLLLDEPSLGLAPLIVDDLYAILQDLIAHSGMSVLLVEQHAEHALDIANWVHVLEVGRIAFSGTTESVRGSEALKAAYLGSWE